MWVAVREMGYWISLTLVSGLWIRYFYGMVTHRSEGFMYRDGEMPHTFFPSRTQMIEWDMLLFFCGMFIMVRSKGK